MAIRAPPNLDLSDASRLGQLLRVSTEETEDSHKSPVQAFKVSRHPLSLKTSAANSKSKGIDQSGQENPAQAQPVEKHVILYPTRLPKQPDINNSFISFNALLKHNRQSLHHLSEDELQGAFTNRETVNRHLTFNKSQENAFRKTAQVDFETSYKNLVNVIEIEKRKQNRMPKIKMYNKKELEKKKYSLNPLLLDENNNELYPIPDHSGQDQQHQQLQQQPTIVASPVNKMKNQVFNVYWYPKQKDISHWKPEARESASFITYGSKGFLYGGISQHIHEDIYMINQQRGWTWDRVKASGDIPQHGRYGHTANVYKNAMVVFGGEKSYNPILRLRECMNDVKFFLLDTFEWKMRKIYGDFVEPRRNHTAVIVGAYLLIHGGINNHGTYLNDLKALHFRTMKWSSCQELNFFEYGIGFHQSCLVVSPARKGQYDLYKFPSYQESEGYNKVKEEGVYFFGGKTEDGKAVNKLKILKINDKPVIWKDLQTEGPTPMARYGHTMIHAPLLNSLVVYGGRNEELYSSNQNPVLNDLHILELSTLTWLKVKEHGESQMYRYSHSCGIFGSKLYIFGGLNYITYCSTDLTLAELDQVDGVKLITKPDTKRKVEPRAEPQFNPMEKYDNLISYLPIPTRVSLKKMFNTNGTRESFESSNGSNFKRGQTKSLTSKQMEYKQRINHLMESKSGFARSISMSGTKMGRMQKG